MKRLETKELLEYLQCPYCKDKLSFGDAGETVCGGCNKSFGSFQGKFVLLREENDFFPAGAYLVSSSIPKEDVISKRKGVFGWIKRWVPSKSVNLAREKMFSRLSADHGKQNKVILVVGCGNQAGQLDRHFSDDTIFVFCDIDKLADADVFCDAHELTFRDEVFDGVISTAVLEHVLSPEKVAAEIYRVIKHSGFIYSEIPFLQSVHEGAYDFTRFTMSGHRRLLMKFEEVEAGMIAGPGTALVWSINDFARSLFFNSRFSSLAGLIARTLFFWLKYFDYLIKDKPVALDAASCTYFYGNKIKTMLSEKEIIRRYQGNKHLHI